MQKQFDEMNRKTKNKDKDEYDKNTNQKKIMNNAEKREETCRDDNREDK